MERCYLFLPWYKLTSTVDARDEPNPAQRTTLGTHIHMQSSCVVMHIHINNVLFGSQVFENIGLNGSNYNQVQKVI